MPRDLLKTILKERIEELKNKRNKATESALLWWSIRDLDELIKLNKKLYFDLFGLYEMGKK